MCVLFEGMIWGRKKIDFGEFESEVYVVLFKGFGGDSGVDLRVNLVKVWEGFDWYD